MKYGVREICDVVFRAKAPMKLGNRTFYKDEPVLYFDTLTTSSLEGAVTTVYAQGGRGNTRLMAWDGERTVTFNMEDALISPEGLSILAGAGLIDASAKEPIKVHTTYSPRVTVTGSGETLVVTMKVPGKVYLSKEDKKDTVYVFPKDDNGNIYTEPFIPTSAVYDDESDTTTITLDASKKFYSTVSSDEGGLTPFKNEGFALVDYYIAHSKNVMQIEITADQFGSNFYIEASTLFKDERGTDHPAEFIIPNGKVQSNFTFSLAASGDPSTFAFTVDAFPDYTRFDQSKKVLSVIQVIGATTTDTEYAREKTVTDGTGAIAGKDGDLKTANAAG